MNVQKYTKKISKLQDKKIKELLYFLRLLKIIIIIIITYPPATIN
jgi:hypothetical protein